MALNFLAANSTDRVDCGSAAILDGIDVGTTIVWERPTTLATRNVIWDKTDPGTEEGMFFAHDVSIGTRFAFQRDRATAALLAVAGVDVVTLDAWNFLAARWDTGGVDGDQQLFHGDLTTIVTEISSYSFQTVGSGFPSSHAAGSFVIGNRGDGTPLFREADGDVAVVAIWNRRLSLGEIRAQQFHPHVTVNCRGFWYLGFNGTGTQPDLSGTGNNGTVTGATVADHVPLGPSFGYDFNWIGVAGAPAPPAPAQGKIDSIDRYATIDVIS